MSAFCRYCTRRLTPAKLAKHERTCHHKTHAPGDGCSCHNDRFQEAIGTLHAREVAPGFYAYRSLGNPATGDAPRFYVLDTDEMLDVTKRLAEHEDPGGAEMPTWWKPHEQEAWAIKSDEQGTRYASRVDAMADALHGFDGPDADCVPCDHVYRVTASLETGEEVPAIDAWVNRSLRDDPSHEHFYKLGICECGLDVAGDYHPEVDEEADEHERP